MTSSLCAVGVPPDGRTQSHEEGPVAPLSQPAPGLYHQAVRPNLWTAS